LLETDDEENIDDVIDGRDSDGENAETTKVGDDDDNEEEENAVAATTTTTATAMEDVLVLDFDAADCRTIIVLDCAALVCGMEMEMEMNASICNTIALALSERSQYYQRRCCHFKFMVHCSFEDDDDCDDGRLHVEEEKTRGIFD